MGRPAVLLVDDDERIREVLRLLLGAEYEVFEAPTGEAALESLRSRDLDLVLLDLVMPGLDGLAVLEEMRGLGRAPPVIVLTAVRIVRVAVEAMKLGAVDFLTKPFRGDDLVWAARRAIANDARNAGGSSVAPSIRCGARAVAAGVLIVGAHLPRCASLAVALEQFAPIEIALVDAAAAAPRSVPPACTIVHVGSDCRAGARFLRELWSREPLSRVILLGADPTCQQEFGKATAEDRLPGEPELTALIMRVAHHLGVPHRVGPTTSQHVRRAMAYLAEHCREVVTLGTVADSVGVSASHLAHRFRIETGVPVKEYLARVRIEIAKCLLRTTDLTIADIAERAGFWDASHLSRNFREITGSPPGTYRRVLP